MKTTYLIILFSIMVLAQIGTPLKMIYDNEDALLSGTTYKFKTRPVDPNDPFRGKYITLRYKMNAFETADTTYVRGDEIRVYIENDEEGFAKAVAISKEPLHTENDYVLAKVNGYYGGKVHFELPFNRFYMEETKAYEAEKAYNDIRRGRTEDTVYTLVRVKKGTSVIEDVIIAGIPIQEYVEFLDEE